MSRSDVAVFVSAGMLAPKKRDHLLARRQLYLNYGALSLATMLDASGTPSVLVHGEHREPAEVLDSLIRSGRLPSRQPLLLSIPSFYALPWAREFCRLVRDADPDARIVVGGRWVVGPDTEWLRTKIPEADVLVPGLGEPVLASLLTDAPDLRRLPSPTPDRSLDHRLVDGFERYQPSIEASRGCGMGCAFCEERDIPLEPLRSPEAVARSLAEVTAQYGDDQIRPYLQASMFAPNLRWATRLADSVRATGTWVRWRTETRVDVLQPRTVAPLAEAGLRVLDLGLETASPAQIVRMRKARDPERYLAGASRLLEACREAGVAAKVNVLLYAGETSETIAETREWLDRHADAIAGVSVGPVVAYGPPRTVDVLLRDWADHGATPVDPGSAMATGITAMNLSREIDAAAAEAISLDLSRRYMDADAYWELKSFSYYPRKYARTDFDCDIAESDTALLPFASSGPGTLPSKGRRTGSALDVIRH